MNLYVVSGPRIPNCFYKAHSKEEVEKKFKVGLKIEVEYAIIEIVSLEQLMNLAPSEFQISANTSF